MYRTNFHWSVALRGSSLSPFNFPSLRFPSLSPFPGIPRNYCSLSPLISTKRMGRQSEKDADRHCTYNTVRGCVSRLGHGPLSLSLSISWSEFAFRVSPRVPGKRRTCDPSAKTGRRRRSSTVSSLVLPPSPFTLRPAVRQQPCGLLRLAAPLSPPTFAPPSSRPLGIN